MNENEQLKEDLLTVKNLITVAEILIEKGYKTELHSPLCTILELHHLESQALIDNYCIVTNPENRLRE